MGDSFKHPIDVHGNLIVPKPQHPVPTFFEILGASGVGPALVFAIVAAAIEFDHEPRFKAEEIHDVRCYGLLAAELDSPELAVAQHCPELLLSVGARAAQSSRALAIKWRRRQFSGGEIFHCGPSPAPSSRPLPTVTGKAGDA